MHAQLQQLWLDSWNADNERAREAYDEDQDKASRYRTCRGGLHFLEPGNVASNGACLACRVEKDRERRGRPRRFRERRRTEVTAEEQRQMVALYTLGESLQAVSVHVRRTPVIVRRMLVQNGVPIRDLSLAAKNRHARNRAA